MTIMKHEHPTRGHDRSWDNPLVVAVHYEAQWIWMHINAEARTPLQEKQLLQGIRRSLRIIGFAGAQVVISVHGPAKMSIATATNLRLIRRVLAVRNHDVVAILADPHQQEPVVLSLLADLPLMGPDDGQYDFLADLGRQAVTQSGGWEQLQAA